MSRPALLAPLLAGLAACTMDLPRRPAPAPEPPTAAGCDASAASALVGRPGGDGEAARIAAGARSVRVVRPGQPVTMDYRPDRLTVELDDTGAIRALRCG